MWEELIKIQKKANDLELRLLNYNLQRNKDTIMYMFQKSLEEKDIKGMNEALKLLGYKVVKI